MNKQQLLDSLKLKSFVGEKGIMGAITDTGSREANGAIRYEINLFETVGDVATARKIQFYVLNEGTDKEVAYWFNYLPEQTIVSK